MESVGDISAEEYEAYAKVWWLTDGRLTGVGAMDAVKRLENETAEMEFVEEVAKAIAAGSHPDMAWGEWTTGPGSFQDCFLMEARAAIDHLQPVAEWLAAEQVWKATAEKPAPRSWPSLDQVPHDGPWMHKNGEICVHAPKKDWPYVVGKFNPFGDFVQHATECGVPEGFRPLVVEAPEVSA